MPVYVCNAAKGAISHEAKEKIAADITRIHCAVTDAPPQFVHAFFLEEGAQRPLDGKQASLFGSIRAGRSDDQREQIAQEMTESIHRHAGIERSAIGAMIAEVPASWVMEGGEIFPEPGEEAAWLEQHNEKLAKHSAGPTVKG